MCLYNKVKQGNHLSLKFIREEEEVRDKVIIEMDPEITVDKGKILVKIDMVITIEEMNTHKILVEIIETEAEVLTEIIVMTEAGHEKEHYLPGGTIIMITIDKMQTLDSDQGPGVDPTQE